MPFINTRGDRLTGNDIQALTAMLRGSLESHIAHLKQSREEESDQPEVLRRFDIAIAAYERGLSSLQGRVDAALQGDQTVRTEDFIRDVFSSLAQEVVDNTPDDLPGKAEFISYVTAQWGEPVFVDQTPTRFVLQQNRDTSYLKHATAFQLAGQPMAGVEQIADYNPNSGRVIQLFEARTGNSNTLGQSMEALQQEREALRNRTDLDAEARAQALADVESRIEVRRNADFGLSTGAELSRMHASAMIARGDRITFGDLYTALSEINRAQRPTDPTGGLLRGGKAVAGAIVGVGASVVPVTLYRTLDTIADYMNQIRATSDPALRKTRAIQLAAYANQMLVSEHVFRDGNGRTCRLFADTILQTFGLPPHIPQPEEIDFVATMGGDMDLNGNAAAFLKGVQDSDTRLKAQPLNQPQPVNPPENQQPVSYEHYRMSLPDLVQDVLEEFDRYKGCVDTGNKLHADIYAEHFRRRVLAERRRNALFDAVFDPGAGLTEEDLRAVFTPEEQQTLDKMCNAALMRTVWERTANVLNEDGSRKYSIVQLNNLPVEQQRAFCAQYLTPEEWAQSFRRQCAIFFRKRETRFRQFAVQLMDHLGDRRAAFNAFVQDYPGVRALTREEMIEHPDDARITELRSNIDKDPNLSPEQKVEYLLALKGAEEILAQGRRKYADTENSEIQKEYDNINTQLEKDRRKKRDKRYAGPDRLLDKTVADETSARKIVFDRGKQLKGINGSQPPISEAYKQTMIRMLRKMREMQILPHDDPQAGVPEAPDKLYAFRNYALARDAYKNAVREGRLQDLKALREAYDREYRDVKELLSMAREGFSDKLHDVPGNLNFNRNFQQLPPEFTEEVTVHSQVNGVYQIYLAMHRLGMDDPQEFMDHFGDNMLRVVVDRANRHTIEHALGDQKQDFGALLQLLSNGSSSQAREMDMDPIITRWQFGLVTSAPEGEDREAIEEYSENLVAAIEDINGRQRNKFNLLTDEYKPTLPGYNAIMQARRNTLENLITVEDADRTHPDELIGFPTVGNNLELKAGFDLAAYAAAHRPDPDAMKNRMNAMLETFEGARRQNKGAVTENEILEAGARSYARLLQVHQVDRDTEWYRRLEQDAQALYDRIAGKQGIEQEARDVLQDQTVSAHTLRVRSGLGKGATIEAFFRMLEDSDSFFHRDTRQIRNIKADIAQIRTQGGTEERLQRLADDIRTWLTDASYNRCETHSRNSFHNTRFNILAGLMHELDPAWFTRHFDSLNLVGLPGDRAQTTAFYNVDNFTKFMHENIVNNGYVPDTLKQQLWYNREYTLGQKGMVEEIRRIWKSPGFMDRQRFVAENGNINKLMQEDRQFARQFRSLFEYNNIITEMLNLGSNNKIQIAGNLQEMREKALQQLETYIKKPENRKSLVFDTAMAAFAVLEPVRANNLIVDLKNQNQKDERIQQMNLVEMEQKHGLDLGGRKAFHRSRENGQNPAQSRNNANVL